ncbi:MAG: response regulator transcription factor [Caldilineaceae bacterium]|nr:response regulator transcription factor [Caldilineaceae bacterium]
MAKAEASGRIRLFVDEGAPIGQLVAELSPTAARYGIADDYFQKVLSALNDVQPEPGQRTAHSDSFAKQPLLEPLSEREVEVLQLIATGHKNQEIADALIVSLNTVRYHTKNLYGKLGVNKRTQAVAKAQALGLL